MRAFYKLGVPAATFVAAVILGAVTTTGTANAGPICRQDVTGHMVGCGFSTMEQCQAASSGIGGDCFLMLSPKGGAPVAFNGSGATPGERWS